MSTIDLKNPKVLKSFLLSQAKEGKGKVFIKEKVLCFKTENGMEFILPDEETKNFIHLIEKRIVEEKAEEEANKVPEENIEELQKAYIEKFKKNPHSAFKNNAEWLKAKLDN